jgi:hypothetical protein
LGWSDFIFFQQIIGVKLEKKKKRKEKRKKKKKKAN